MPLAQGRNWVDQLNFGFLGIALTLRILLIDEVWASYDATVDAHTPSSHDNSLSLLFHLFPPHALAPRGTQVGIAADDARLNWWLIVQAFAAVMQVCGRGLARPRPCLALPHLRLASPRL